MLATVDLDDDRCNADRRKQEIAPLKSGRAHPGRPRRVGRLQRTGRLDKAAEWELRHKPANRSRRPIRDPLHELPFVVGLRELALERWRVSSRYREVVRRQLGNTVQARGNIAAHGLFRDLPFKPRQYEEQALSVWMQRWRHATRKQLPHRVDYHQRPAVVHRRAVSTFLPRHPTIGQSLSAPIRNRAQRAADSGVERTPTRPAQRPVRPMDATSAQTQRTYPPQREWGRTQGFAITTSTRSRPTIGVHRASRFPLDGPGAPASRVPLAAPESATHIAALARQPPHHCLPALRAIRRDGTASAFQHQYFWLSRRRSARWMAGRTKQLGFELGMWCSNVGREGTA